MAGKKLKIQYLGLIVVLAVITIVIAGCWDRRDPELLAFVLAAGFDRSQDGGDYKIMAQIFNPLAMGQQSTAGGGGDGNSKEAAWVVESTGRTPFEARKNLAHMVSRELFWSYTGVVLISEELARAGIRPVMDLLERERQFRLITRPLIVEGDVHQILANSFPLEETSGQALWRQIQTGDKMRSVAPVTEMRELINVLSHPGHEMLIARIKDQSNMEDEQDNENSSEDMIKIAAPAPASLDGGAAFRGDKMVGWVGNKETRGWHWVQGKVKRETLVVASPVDERPVSIEIFRTSANMKPESKGDKLKMKIEIRTMGRIQDQVSGTDVVLNEETLSSIEDRLATLIKTDIWAAIERSQELDSDILGFGNAIYRLKPKDWDRLEPRWPSLLHDIEVDLDVRTKITVAGLTKQPMGID